jgi:hypothetical protein
LSPDEAIVAFKVAQPVPRVVPTAGQPQAVPVGTTPAELQVIGGVHAIVVEVTVTQPLASLVH